MFARNTIVLAIWFFPFVVCAEPQRLECNIKFGDFVDVYTVEIDANHNMVYSTFHAASNKDRSVTLDYKISSDAIINDDEVVYRANLHSLDYAYVINRKTLEIIRYINEIDNAEVGRGLCHVIEASGKKL